jgi:glycosyltransferase involved in cell wall biosynthesis
MDQAQHLGDTEVLLKEETKSMKVAIVHDWLTLPGGGERVIEQIVKIFPDAEIFTLVYKKELYGWLENHKVHTSFIQKLPRGLSKYRMYLPLMPLAIEQFDLSKFDIIISSSHAVAKGVLTGPDQIHICYCHSPMRYAWDMQHEYLQDANLMSGLKSWFVRYTLHKIRIWDYRTSAGVDSFVANSAFIERRIRKVYGRASTVIYPPVDVDGFFLDENKDGFYLTASRLVSHKKVPLIAKAFAGMPDKKLVIVGDGPEMERVRQESQNKDNITLLGHVSFEKLRSLMQKSRGFVFAAKEDFGIVSIEAQACGTPVIAYGSGGSLETIRGLDDAHPTGLHFAEQTAESIRDGIEQFEKNYDRFSAVQCRMHAETFSVALFRERFSSHILSVLSDMAVSMPRRVVHAG